MIYKVSPRIQSSIWLWTAYKLKCSCPRKIISKITVSKSIFVHNFNWFFGSFISSAPIPLIFSYLHINLCSSPTKRKLKIKMLIKSTLLFCLSPLSITSSFVLVGREDLVLPLTWGCRPNGHLYWPTKLPARPKIHFHCFELIYPSTYPTYDLLEHEKELVLWK